MWGMFWGPGGETPSRREKHGGLGAEPPAQKKFSCFFAKTTYFRDNLIKINLLKRCTEINSANMIKLVG